VLACCSVLYISLHRYEDGFFYPGKEDANYTYVGKGQGEGYNINIPWNSQVKIHLYRGADRFSYYITNQFSSLISSLDLATQTYGTYYCDIKAFII